MQEAMEAAALEFIPADGSSFGGGPGVWLARK